MPTQDPAPGVNPNVGRQFKQPSLGPDFDKHMQDLKDENIRRIDASKTGELPEDSALRISMPMENAVNVAKVGKISTGFDPDAMGIVRPEGDRSWGGDAKKAASRYSLIRLRKEKHVFDLPTTAPSSSRPIYASVDSVDEMPKKEGPLFGDVRFTLQELPGRKVTAIPGYTLNAYGRSNKLPFPDPEGKTPEQLEQEMFSKPQEESGEEAGEYVKKLIKPLNKRYVTTRDPDFVFPGAPNKPEGMRNYEVEPGNDEAHIWGGPIPLNKVHKAEVFSGTFDEVSPQAEETVKALRDAGVRTSHMVYGEYQPTLSEAQFGTGKVGWVPRHEP